MHDLIQLAELNNEGRYRMTPRSGQPKVESLTSHVGDAEPRRPSLIAAIRRIRKPSHAEDTITSAGRIPAPLRGGSNDALRVGDYEVVGRPVAPEQAAANSLNPFSVPGPLLSGKRLENHANLVIAGQTDTRLVNRRHNAGTTH